MLILINNWKVESEFHFLTLAYHEQGKEPNKSFTITLMLMGLGFILLFPNNKL